MGAAVVGAGAVVGGAGVVGAGCVVGGEGVVGPVEGTEPKDRTPSSKMGMVDAPCSAE